MAPSSKFNLYFDTFRQQTTDTANTDTPVLIVWIGKNPRIDWQHVVLISSVLVVHNHRQRQRFCWAAATLNLCFSGGAGAELSAWSSLPHRGAFEKAIQGTMETHT